MNTTWLTKDGGFGVVRQSASDESAPIVGYASTFGPPADSVGDIVSPGAFRRSLAERPQVPVLWCHDSKEPIGRTEALTEDAKGLLFKGTLVPTARGRDAILLSKAGALTGVSFGFDIRDSRPLPGGGRELRDITLWEVSLTPFPANPRAQLVTASMDLSAIEDALTIAQVEAMKAQGLQHWRMDMDYVGALERQIERLSYGGKTAREVIADLERELNKLR